MQPRPYQTEAVKSARKAVKKHGNTLLILPVGAGKTVVSGFYHAEEITEPEHKALFLQPTEELLEQNMSTVAQITGLPCSIVKAEKNDFGGQIVFASTATLARANRREDMPRFTHVTIDEAHLAVTPSMQAIIAHIELMGGAKRLGMTATPGRGDGRSLRSMFDNVGYQMKIGELIAMGILVPPKVFTIELGLPLDDLPKIGGDVDLAAAAELLDKAPLNSRVVDEWEQKAKDRATIAFATTVRHATEMADEWVRRGYRAAVISGETKDDDRKALIAAFKAGEIQILTNCGVLVAGFDAQMVGCVIINRPMYSHANFIQALGRGLRKLDPERFPGWPAKSDCIVLDFCGAAARHGTLEFEVDLDSTAGNGERLKPYKQCPSCYGYVPSATRCCDLCGHVWHVAEDASGRPRIITDFSMTEIDLLNASPFKYVDLLYDGYSLIATAFTAWAGVFFDGANWHAVGRRKGENVRHIGIGTKIQAMATADDFLRMYGDKKAARKTKRWLTEESTEAQKELLRKHGFSVGMLDFSWTKARAAATLDFAFARNEIKRVISGC